MRRYTKVPVGAHSGTGDWLLQRLTAVVMALYTVGLVVCLAWHAPATYAEWKSILSGTFVRLTTMLFIAALLYHAWVGLRDILMDYLRATGIRLTAQFVVGLVLVSYLIWSAAILWGR